MGTVAAMEEGTSLSLKKLSRSPIVADVVENHLLPFQNKLDAVKLSDSILPLIREGGALEEVNEADCQLQ